MTDKDTFIMRKEWRENFKMLSEKQMYQLVIAIFDYECDGITPKFDDIALVISFNFIRSALDAYDKNYQQTCEKNAKRQAEYRERKKAQTVTPVTDSNACYSNGCNKHNVTDVTTVTPVTDSNNHYDTDYDSQSHNDNDTHYDIDSDSDILPPDGETNTPEFSESSKPKTKKTVKHKFGEYGHVKLTDEQSQKLIDEYGEKVFNEYVTKIDEYCQLHGKSYKDYYLAIKNWIRRDNENGKSYTNTASTTGNNTSSDDEFIEPDTSNGPVWTKYGWYL